MTEGKDGNKDKWDYINSDGEYAINPQFSEAFPFTGDLACVSNGDKYGFINVKGEYVINPQFEKAGIFLNKMAPVKNDKTLGYIDEQGKFVINPQFEETLCFTGDLAPVSQNDVRGYINTEGKIIVNTQFEDASMFIGNIAVVESNDKYGFIDKEGKFTVNPQFDKIDISKINMYALFGTGFSIYNNTLSSNKNEPAEDVALAFLKAFNKNDTVEAKKLATEESYSYITLMAGLSNLGGSSKEKKIENMKCVDNDDKSKCTYTQDGEEKQIDLVKKNDKWLVDMKKESSLTDNNKPAGIISVISVTASSYMAQSGNNKYTPEMAVDNDLQTWWSPASPHSDGMNSWLKIDFGGIKKVNGIEIHNGSHFLNYPKYGNLYLKNNRLKKARLEFSNGSSEIITLKNIDEIQKINFSPVKTYYIKLVPLEISKGSAWNDLCISSFKAVEE